MNTILISLTVIHTRLAKLHLTLQSLLAQDHKDFEVRVHASREPFLLDEGAREVPAGVQRLIAEDSRLSWRWVPNIGSYRKLLPALNETIDDDQLIVTADDDTIYPSGWLSTLAQNYSLFNCIISFRGHFIAIDNAVFAPYRSWMRHGIIENPSELVLPTGKDGVLYHTSHFDRRVLNYVRALHLAPTADDLWFKWHTAVNNVPVYCIEPDYTKGSLVDTGEGPSLYLNFNNMGANDRAVARLHSYAQAEWGFDLAKVFTRRVATLNGLATTNPANNAKQVQQTAEEIKRTRTNQQKTTADAADRDARISARPRRSTWGRIIREINRFFRRLKRTPQKAAPPARESKLNIPSTR